MDGGTGLYSFKGQNILLLLIWVYLYMIIILKKNYLALQTDLGHGNVEWIVLVLSFVCPVILLSTHQTQPF